jgi:hypothetical protein
MHRRFFTRPMRGKTKCFVLQKKGAKTRQKDSFIFSTIKFLHFILLQFSNWFSLIDFHE